MEPRTYRHWIEGKDLVPFGVTVRETDLYIRAATNLQRKAHRIVLKHRRALERYIERNPAFLTSLEPLSVPEDAPHIAREMAAAGRQAGVGPMAAVAGAIAEFVGRELLDFSPEVIVENGGDIYLKTLKKRTVGIYAGGSPLSGKIGVAIDPDETPLGICTSSGTVGHSLSLGSTDAVVVIAPTAVLADAAATAIGNRVKEPEDITDAIEFAKGISDITGVIIIKDTDIGIWGNIRLCQTSV
jgi:ApbE superfamily uncharacterized protein (UPF0280 family)